jgi:DMSO/TMAO reductase YedYZ heme-binding membrane subunit
MCGDRQLVIEKDSSAHIQGEQTTLVTAYCVDGQTGDKQDVSKELMSAITRLQMITGVVSGLIVFGLAMVFLQWAARRLNTPWEKMFQPSVRRDQ